MLEAVLKYIDAILELVQPTELCFVAVDGPPPRAKINQQRSRRFLAAMEAGDRARMQELAANPDPNPNPDPDPNPNPNRDPNLKPNRDPSPNPSPSPSPDPSHFRSKREPRSVGCSSRPPSRRPRRPRGRRRRHGRARRARWRTTAVHGRARRAAERGPRNRGRAACARCATRRAPSSAPRAARRAAPRRAARPPRRSRRRPPRPSPISRLYLHCISPVSPLHLDCISPASPLHLPCISPASPRAGRRAPPRRAAPLRLERAHPGHRAHAVAVRRGRGRP